MDLGAALARATASINAIPRGGLANGDVYANTSTPTTSHIREWLKWPLTGAGDMTGLADNICRYGKVNLDTAGRDAEANKADIDTAVIVAIARAAAWRYYGWGRNSLSVAELDVIAGAELRIHADHEAAVAEALAKWAAPAARYMGLFYYNSISYETSAHHHLPAVTKKLATTTILLAGLKEWIAGNAEREGSVFHDMFHPLSDTEKSNAARRVSAKPHLSNLKFDNLRKRIPVKAPDSGVAINYSVLYRKARAYDHLPDDLPTTLACPERVMQAVTAYENAVDAAALTVAVTSLRDLSELLAEPSAYLAGFILGREAAAAEDADLDLRTAARTTTILGSPAYMRAAGEFSGTFTAGKTRGYARVPPSVASAVLPRCVDAVTAAGRAPAVPGAPVVPAGAGGPP